MLEVRQTTGPRKKNPLEPAPGYATSRIRNQRARGPAAGNMQLRASRWSALAGCLPAAAAAGAIYTFGVYSAALKKQFDFDQPTLTIIPTMATTAGCLSW